MKINSFKILSLLFIIIIGVECFAQSGDYYYKENLRRIDAYINGPIKTHSCEEGMTFPAKYKASKVRSDLRMMSFVSSLFNNKTTEGDIGKEIIKVRKKEIPIKKSVNGLIESNDITILGKYLWVNVKLDFIDNVLVRSKVTLRTTTHGKCGSHGHLLDFKVIKDFFINDVKMLFDVGYDEMTSDTIYSDNLVSLAEERNGYKFNIPGSNAEDWINEIFTKQYQSDNYGFYSIKAPKEFVRLIKENKTDVIKDLLYSPSYFTSIDAMEALIYLSSIGKFQITKEISDRIIQIKKETFIIMQPGAPDVFYTRKGYKELRIGEDDVIRKYRSSL